MTIRYHCRHCNTEIGSLPFESATEVLQLLKRLDEKDEERFLVRGKDGELKIRSICEHCEQSLESFPDYYMSNKWLQ